MRMSFWEIFRVNSDGSVEPLRKVSVGGIQFGPGVRFGKGVSFSGIDLTEYIGKDFRVEEESEILKLIGVYG